MRGMQATLSILGMFLGMSAIFLGVEGDEFAVLFSVLLVAFASVFIAAGLLETSPKIADNIGAVFLLCLSLGSAVLGVFRFSNAGYDITLPVAFQLGYAVVFGTVAIAQLVRMRRAP